VSPEPYPSPYYPFAPVPFTRSHGSACRVADAIHAFPTVARVLGTALADAAWELATGEKAWA